jgi:hypothetical protein
LAVLLSLGVSARYVRNGGASCVIETARAEIGVTETSENWSPRIAEYLSSVNVHTPAYWCAAFVHWCFERCGVETSITAWSPSAVANNVIWTRGKGQTPREGDVGSLYYSNLGRVGHTFLIEKWGDKVVTIEGNSNDNGSRNGVKVCRRIRLAKTLYKVSRWN